MIVERECAQCNGDQFFDCEWDDDPSVGLSGYGCIWIRPDDLDPTTMVDVPCCGCRLTEAQQQARALEVAADLYAGGAP